MEKRKKTGKNSKKILLGHSGASAGESIFLKMVKFGQNRPKMAKNGLFFAVFSIFEPKIYMIRPTSATFLDSVGQNGAFKPILKIFPFDGCMGVTKNWVFGIGGTLCNTKNADF